jgi:hypothetical protein
MNVGREKEMTIKHAISKLNDEMAKNQNHPYVQFIGQFLTNKITCPATAELVLNEKKTILGSLEAMRKEAEKVKVGNCAVLSDEQGFAIVLDYFGIKEEDAATKPVKKKTKKRANKVTKIEQTTLFDFIGEA